MCLSGLHSKVERQPHPSLFLDVRGAAVASQLVKPLFSLAYDVPVRILPEQVAHTQQQRRFAGEEQL